MTFPKQLSSKTCWISWLRWTKRWTLCRINSALSSICLKETNGKQSRTALISKRKIEIRAECDWKVKINLKRSWSCLKSSLTYQRKKIRRWIKINYIIKSVLSELFMMNALMRFQTFIQSIEFILLFICLQQRKVPLTIFKWGYKENSIWSDFVNSFYFSQQNLLQKHLHKHNTKLKKSETIPIIIFDVLPMLVLGFIVG